MISCENYRRVLENARLTDSMRKLARRGESFDDITAALRASAAVRGIAMSTGDAEDIVDLVIDPVLNQHLVEDRCMGIEATAG